MISRPTCGEVTESTAARLHAWAHAIMLLCLGIEAAALFTHAVMAVFHRASVRTHERRAIEAGEP